MTEIRHRAAVLGKPISHSLSPLIHNTAYKAMGLADWFYDSHEIDERSLADFVGELDSSWHGLSLTMPLKKTIMPMGEPANRWAEKLGVANTAVFDWSTGAPNPRIRLYNTDVAGINLALTNAMKRHHVSVPDEVRSNGLIIGSGSTATSAIAALSTMQVQHVTIAARHPEKAHALAPLAQSFGMSVDVIAMGQIPEAVPNIGIVISTLPSRAADSTAVQLERLQKGSLPGVLLDVVYSPRPSELIRVWRQLGAAAVGGEEMLLYQAIPQIAYMTGTDFDKLPPHLDSTIRAALEEVL
ncbi:shikimate dehydrogenase [Bifidobacterium sp. SMB2]|uniref:shikimate dehydrogenase (NADP(+)) n=1 Tax=Bifidobacterium saimiriisciurei TaxID=2661627 RepID=A0ABX0CA69_9BIFI|nr:shikimate dehydrogenase [Bifidobacterium saimiriisciurei]NEG96874.1 shikimate dehydrogenase [Bifidobacterium sp. SMB2]NEH11596.1 shikimate dehydrogenase [Bifidobacterium saimiriisciurei]